MRRSVVATLAVIGLLVLSTVAGASTKFDSTEAIDSSGSLVVTFEEGSLKRFSSVEYRLDASASAVFELDGGQQIGRLWNPGASVTLTPDAKGRIDGALVLDISESGRCLEFPCGTLRHVEYFDTTLTNLTTGRSYHLEEISQDNPG